MIEDEAFVSLVTNDSYGNGALVLGYSLRQVNTTRKLALLVSSFVSEPMRQRLSRVWDRLVVVDLLDSGDEMNLALLTRPELGITFTKLHAWNLTQYKKCVFLDADTLVLQNVDELFHHAELSAVPDVGWPDCFNSGVFVFEPSRVTYEALLQYAVQNGSFDGGDQGLINAYFKDWKRMSFVYNMNSNASYTYAPAFKQFGRNVKIVHFLGPLKPWHFSSNTDTGEVHMPSQNSGIMHERGFLQFWWDTYNTYVNPVNRQSHGHCSVNRPTHAPTNHDQPRPHPHILLHPPLPPSMPHDDSQPQPVADSSPPTEDSEPEVIQIAPDENGGRHNVHQVTDGMSDLQLDDPDHCPITEGPEITPEEREHAHRRAWECGRIDYMGIDGFRHIQDRLDMFIS